MFIPIPMLAARWPIVCAISMLLLATGCTTGRLTRGDRDTEASTTTAAATAREGQTARAGDHAAHGGHAQAHGTVDFPISCGPASQAAFNDAMTRLHHMTYPQAHEAFRAIAIDDPPCAMAHWGVAMTLFQPLWPTRPNLAARENGLAAAQRAQVLAPPTARERALIDAAVAFFTEPASEDYWLRIRRWEAAMSRAYDAMPDDTEVALFYALAHLATTPANRVSREHADRAAAILLRIHEKFPHHPGAMHYLVHANDIPGREHESLDVTHQYDENAPENPHALHMPTHIYTRIGDWDGVIRGNLRAASAALKYPAGEHGEFVWDEFAHAIEYLVYAYLQQGNDDAARAQIERLRTATNIEPTFKTAFHLSSTQARHALERRAWGEAAAIVPRDPATIAWDKFAWPEAIAQFARGLGAVHAGRYDEATAVLARLDTLDDVMTAAGEDLFARNIRVLRFELDAWLLDARGEHDAAVARMRDAVTLEAETPKHAVTPGPTLPADEQLGDLFTAQARHADALAAYRQAMTRYPNRFNSLLGAARAAHLAGEDGKAREYYQRLLDVAGASTRRAEIHEARSALATGRRPR